MFSNFLTPSLRGQRQEEKEEESNIAPQGESDDENDDGSDAGGPNSNISSSNRSRKSSGDNVASFFSSHSRKQFQQLRQNIGEALKRPPKPTQEDEEDEAQTNITDEDAKDMEDFLLSQQQILQQQGEEKDEVRTNVTDEDAKDMEEFLLARKKLAMEDEEHDDIKSSEDEDEEIFKSEHSFPLDLSDDDADDNREAKQAFHSAHDTLSIRISSKPGGSSEHSEIFNSQDLDLSLIKPNAEESSLYENSGDEYSAPLDSNDNSLDLSISQRGRGRRNEMKNNVIMLYSKSKFATARQKAEQYRAKAILKANNIDPVYIDGSNPLYRNKRNKLFTLSGMKGTYPQFFVQPKTDTRDKYISCIGDFNVIKDCNDKGLLKEVMGGVEEQENSEKNFEGGNDNDNNANQPIDKVDTDAKEEEEKKGAVTDLVGDPPTEQEQMLGEATTREEETTQTGRVGGGRFKSDRAKKWKKRLDRSRSLERGLKKKATEREEIRKVEEATPKAEDNERLRVEDKARPEEDKAAQNVILRKAAFDALQQTEEITKQKVEDLQSEEKGEKDSDSDSGMKDGSQGGSDLDLAQVDDRLYTEEDEATDCEDVRRLAQELTPQFSELEDVLQSFSSEEKSNAVDIAESANRTMDYDDDSMDNELLHLATSEKALQDELEFAEDINTKLMGSFTSYPESSFDRSKDSPKVRREDLDDGVFQPEDDERSSTSQVEENAAATTTGTEGEEQIASKDIDQEHGSSTQDQSEELLLEERTQSNSSTRATLGTEGEEQIASNDVNQKQDSSAQGQSEELPSEERPRNHSSSRDLFDISERLRQLRAESMRRKREAGATPDRRHLEEKRVDHASSKSRESNLDSSESFESVEQFKETKDETDTARDDVIEQLPTHDSESVPEGDAADISPNTSSFHTSIIENEAASAQNNVSEQLTTDDSETFHEEDADVSPNTSSFHTSLFEEQKEFEKYTKEFDEWKEGSAKQFEDDNEGDSSSDESDFDGEKEENEDEDNNVDTDEGVDDEEAAEKEMDKKEGAEVDDSSSEESVFDGANEEDEEKDEEDDDVEEGVDYDDMEEGVEYEEEIDFLDSIPKLLGSDDDTDNNASATLLFYDPESDGENAGKRPSLLPVGDNKPPSLLELEADEQGSSHSSEDDGMDVGEKITGEDATEKVSDQLLAQLSPSGSKTPYLFVDESGNSPFVRSANLQLSTGKTKDTSLGASIETLKTNLKGLTLDEEHLPLLESKGISSFDDDDEDKKEHNQLLGPEGSKVDDRIKILERDVRRLALILKAMRDEGWTDSSDDTKGSDNSDDFSSPRQLSEPEVFKIRRKSLDEDDNDDEDSNIVERWEDDPSQGDQHRKSKKKKKGGWEEDEICCYWLCKWIPDPVVIFVCSNVLRLDG